MANDTDAAASSRPVSPTVGVKREHSDEEDDSARRVSQRTETSNNNEDEQAPSMKQLVLKDLRSDDQDVLVNALKQIWKKMNVAVTDPRANDAKKEFHRLGGHGILVSGAMTQYPNCEEIQDRCILVICSGTYMNEDLCIAFAFVDGMQAILAAMDKFRTTRRIQQGGIVALLNMTCSNDSNAKTLVQDLNGIPAILGVMDRFSNIEDVADTGCLLLRCLCRLEELRQPIFNANVLSALGKSRDAFKENNVIKQNVKAGMKYFVTYCDAT